jgi:proline dehydrogenase
MLRSALLGISGNRWLADHLPNSTLGRRISKRFIPGERLEDAVRAATQLTEAGLRIVLSELGEEVRNESAADGACAAYEAALEALAAAQLEPQISVKPTHLGLAMDEGRAITRTDRLLEAAQSMRGFVWIDMEGSAYTEATVRMYERLRAAHPNAGLCLQAYLRRTPADVERLLPLGPRIRLVKGAYKEPAAIAFQKKSEVNAAYVDVAHMLMQAADRGATVALATHDVELVERIGGDCEVQMLYGIRADEQRRLSASGRPVRVLISYGSEWFAWYVRRLAERPANLLFALRAAAGSTTGR